MTKTFLIKIINKGETKDDEWEQEYPTYIEALEAQFELRDEGYQVSEIEIIRK